MGPCSYYRRWMFGFAAVVKSLHQLRERNKDFQWNSEAQQLFEQLKYCIVLLPTLVLPVLKESFNLFTAMNHFAIGAVPAQAQNDLEQVTNYASNFLSQTQSRYLTRKFTNLAIINCARHFRHHFLGRQFKIIRHNTAFQWRHKFEDPNTLTARWLELRAEIDYEVEHQSYESVGHVDRMLRVTATAAVRNITKTIDFHPSAECQSNLSSQNFISSNTLFTPAPQLNCNTMSRDTDKFNQTGYEHSEVEKSMKSKKKQNQSH